MTITPIDEVSTAIAKKRNALIRASNNPDYNPKLVVYMSIEFWEECMGALYGQVSPVSYEFYTGDKVMGFPVYRVLPPDTRTEGANHARYYIFEVK